MLKLKNSSGILIQTLLLACAVMAGLYTPPAMARHGEGTLLTNRIPEPAPYEVTETTGGGGQIQNPPFENLWTSLNDTGSCDGCHTGLYDQWNGSMMANAWRDPGWRGAFLGVARLTSTDGCNDITPVLSTIAGLTGRARDGSEGFDCSTPARKLNPFANANGTSTFNVIPETTTPFPGVTAASYTGSGSLMDDFCSRCHMPTNYVDATIGVSREGGLGGTQFEHGHISPTYDPTSVNPNSLALADPVAALGTARESFGPRFDTVVYSTIPGAPNATVNQVGLTASRAVNSNSGQSGIICEACHTNVASRLTPYHGYTKTGTDYFPATKTGPRGGSVDGATNAAQGLTAAQQDMFTVPNHLNTDLNQGPNLGYAIGAGAFRLSPHALATPERFGPLSWNSSSAAGAPAMDAYITEVYAGGRHASTALGGSVSGAGGIISTTNALNFIKANPPGKHDTFYQVKFERAEFCGACHDVTNPATIKNEFGNWVGGFPIERTYTEYLSSRYADRTSVVNGVKVPNPNYDANYKRDCQTCHMQQSFGQPGTALTLYRVEGGIVTPDVAPLDNTATPPPPILDDRAALSEPSCDSTIHNPGYSHHFVGGNAYITTMIGADIAGGVAAPYPELLETSFSSRDSASRLHYARFDTVVGARSGPVQTQHERFAWDRLRNALTMTLTVDQTSIALPATETVVNLGGAITNEGSGHNFPTGFPEGRTAWVRVVAWDTRNGAVTSPYGVVPGTGTLVNGQIIGGQSVELQIRERVNATTTRNSLGVGYLTSTAQLDPTFPGCNWSLPAGSADPLAITFKAVASADGTCPTLELPYATPINLITDAANGLTNGLTGRPIDANGVVIDRNNPTGIPRYRDGGTAAFPKAANGDFFDDSFLRDTRLQPMKGTGAVNPHATVSLSRYSVVVPAKLLLPSGLPSATALMGPVAITATVYYQSFEAVVARDFLGNLANLDDVDSNEGFLDVTKVVNGAIVTGADGANDSSSNTPILETCVLKGACDRIGKPGVTGEIQLRNALRLDPVVVDGAPPVPMITRNQVIQIGSTTDTVAPFIVINNSNATGQTNVSATIPANRHWSPSPYGGAAGNYPVEGVGEQNVNPARIVKVSFNEPVTGVDANTFYLTTSRGVAVPALISQIDDTTWALFPYTSTNQTFLSASTNIVHVAPSRNGSTIRDFAGRQLQNGPTTTPATDVNQWTFGFKIL